MQIFGQKFPKEISRKYFYTHFNLKKPFCICIENISLTNASESIQLINRIIELGFQVQINDIQGLINLVIESIRQFSRTMCKYLLSANANPYLLNEYRK